MNRNNAQEYAELDHRIPSRTIYDVTVICYTQESATEYLEGRVLKEALLRLGRVLCPRGGNSGSSWEK